MFRVSVFRSVTATLLVVFLVISTAPLSAADFGSSKAVLGSVHTAGQVIVRNVSVIGETTMFDGDRIHTGGKSYAKVALADGNKVELGSDSDLLVTSSGGASRGVLGVGGLGFTASRKPMAFTIADFEVRPSAGSRGVVSFIGADFAGIRAVNGSLTVVDLKSGKTSVVASGKDHFLNVKAHQMNVPLTQVASAGSLPALPRAAGSSAAQGGLAGAGLSAAVWAGIIGAIVGGIVLIAVVASDDEASPSNP